MQAALAPLMHAVQVAFVYGSIAKGTETAASDVDLMLVGDAISYGTLLSVLSPRQQTLGRPINPTIYTLDEFRKRRHDHQHFLMRVLEQPKIFLTVDSDALRRLGQPGADSQTQA
ncbi:nucleotidyltransferase domain-containing protein [Actimicrobium antarcticum]|uniref:Polymerase beta nucleotidyltransferase domain-containing protein n=1 Tax=Actimicrobium antarcticum TaxID=1051899 RepID=A0ABP7TYV9_9BURK